MPGGELSTVKITELIASTMSGFGTEVFVGIPHVIGDDSLPCHDLMHITSSDLPDSPLLTFCLPVLPPPLGSGLPLDLVLDCRGRKAPLCSSKWMCASELEHPPGANDSIR